MTPNANDIARNAIIKAAQQDRNKARRCYLCDAIRVPAITSVDGRSVCNKCIVIEPEW